MIKRLFIKVALFGLIVTGMSVCLNTVTDSRADAAASLCGVLAYAPSGNCQLGQDYTALTSLSGSSNQLKSQFISKMNGFRTGQHFQQVGADYIVNRMFGGWGNWQNVINQANVTFVIQNHSYTTNTAYDPSSDSDITYADVDTRQALVMYYQGVYYDAIKLDCGNPVGRMNVITQPTPIAGTLTIQCTGSNPNQYVVSGYDTGGAGSPVNFQIRYDTTSGSVKYGGTTHNGDTTVRTGGFTNGRTYVLMIQDNDDGSWNYADQAIPNCSGGGVCGVVTCSTPSSSPGCTTTSADDSGVLTTFQMTPVGFWSLTNIGSHPPSYSEVNIWDSSDPPGAPGWTPNLVNGAIVGKIGVNPSLTFNYTPQGSTVYVQVINYEDGLPHAAPRGYYAYNSTTTPLDCYDASCHIDSVTALDGGPVVAGEDFLVTATLFNTAPPSGASLPANIGPYPLSITSSVNGTATAHPTGQVDLGASKQIQYNGGAAPAAPGFFTIPAPYPDYFGDGNMLGSHGFGAACSGLGSIPAGTRFSLTPTVSATFVGDPENPSAVIRSASVTASGMPVSETVTAELYEAKQGVPVKILATPQKTNGGPFIPGNPYVFWVNDTRPINLPINAGDSYCAEVDVPYASGVIAPDGVTILPGAVPGTPAVFSLAGGPPTGNGVSCQTIQDKPTFKVYGGSVASGGSFSPGGASSCSSGSGNLAGWNHSFGGAEYGSGAQFGALSLTSILGFASAQGASAGTPLGLTFANTTPSAPDAYSPTLGGLFGDTQCLTSLATGSSGVVSGPVVIGGHIVPLSHNESYYVDGDVYISDDITYQGAALGWTSKNMPSFVVRATGNIYISKDVHELDGVYEAIPRPDGSAGKIHTCGVQVGFSAFKSVFQNDPANYFSLCNNQLTVYGSFVANEVEMERTYGSLRDEGAGSFGPTCSNAGITSSGRHTCAAEVFEQSPEMYLNTPDIGLPSGGALQYDAVTSLPPVL